MTTAALNPVTPREATLRLGRQGFAAISAAMTATGIPMQRFQKEIMAVGEYVKGDMQISITPDTLANWVQQFNAMRANGVRVSIPTQHHTDGNPDQNNGWVDDLFIEGDRLIMACTLIGADAIKAAARSDVSIYSPPQFVDGKGNKYAQPIVHVAMVTDPVVPGLGAFVPISFSQQGAPAMDLTFLQTIATALGVAEPVTAENYQALITNAVNALVAKVRGVPSPAAPPPAPPSDPGGPVPAGPPAGGGMSTPTPGATVKKVTTEYAASMQPHNPQLVKLLADNRRLKIEQLVRDGKISPAVRDKMIARFIGDKNAAVELALSRSDDGSDFDAMIEAFTINQPLRRGEQTGGQIAMSNPIAAEGKDQDRLAKKMEERSKRRT